MNRVVPILIVSLLAVSFFFGPKVSEAETKYGPWSQWYEMRSVSVYTRYKYRKREDGQYRCVVEVENKRSGDVQIWGLRMHYHSKDKSGLAVSGNSVNSTWYIVESDIDPALLRPYWDKIEDK